MPPAIISQPHSLLHFLWNYFYSQTITECLKIIFGAVVIESTDLISFFISLALSVAFVTTLSLPWKTPLLSPTAAKQPCPKIQCLGMCFSLDILTFLQVRNYPCFHFGQLNLKSLAPDLKSLLISILPLETEEEKNNITGVSDLVVPSPSPYQSFLITESSFIFQNYIFDFILLFRNFY